MQNIQAESQTVPPAKTAWIAGSVIYFRIELEIANFIIDKSPSLCYNDLAFGQIFFVHRLVIAN